jgi:two-component system sensor histidine kinase RegB
MLRHVLTGRQDAAPYIDSAPAIGLAWLVRIRLGFAATLVVVAFGAQILDLNVDFGIPLAACAATLATDAALFLWSRRGRTPSSLLIAGVLLLDAALLTLALGAAGGALNPLSVLYLVHVALAALLLDQRAKWIVVIATCLGFGTLFWRVPMAGHHHEHHAAMAGHLRGMFAAYALAAGLVAYCVDRVARALERREREMIAMREWASRTEKLASLSALAAGAAHELGTPLGTIVVIARELERSSELAVVDGPRLAADAQLLREEAERCRGILAKMATHAGEGPAGPPRRTSASEIIERVLRSVGEPRASELKVEAPPPGAFVEAPDDALVQVLVNIVSNAFEASAEKSGKVVFGAAVDAKCIAFRIEDTGLGMAEDILRRLGEPFFSTKEGRGMGLGLFLARRFAEGAGGSLEVESRVGVGTRFSLAVPGGVA